MVQDIAPNVYHNEFRKRAPQIGDRLLIFIDEKALLRVLNNTIIFPELGQYPGIVPEDCRSLFQVDEFWYVMPVSKVPEVISPFCLYSFREYRKFRPFSHLFPAAVGGSLFRWYRDNRFCGRCGSIQHDSESERALVCPSCGKITYPKICPAVIVAVRNGNRLLLTKYANRPGIGYALIAGFAEIGEPIEQTVHREVLEECGVHVKNLKFYKSQPWVFTDTLLMGFFCDLDGSDEITLQEDELSVGEWVSRADVPEDDQHVSLTSEMIELFRTGRD